MKIEQLYQLFIKQPLICTDTRKIAPDSLFFALKGDNFDGNKFAAYAIENGCAYAIIDDEQIASDNPQYILVDNVLATLQQLANYHRRQLNIPILSITGTNGKTTTKELIGKVLSKKFNIGITQGNLNNHIGVPITLLSMTKDTDFGVVEMGANHFGEIAELCKITEPNYGLITNVGKAHLEGFGSLEGVKKTKGELYDYLENNNGLAFVNTDDEILVSMYELRKNLRIQPYSSSLYNVKLSTTNNLSPFLGFTLKNDIEIKTSLLGDYNLNNILAAIAIGEYFEIDDKVIIEAIESYQPENNRSQLIRTKHNSIYMDAYNANPSSMEAAINNFSQLNEENKLLILGDMLELGKDSENEHKKVIEQTTLQGLKNVWFVGENFNRVSNNSEYLFFNTIDELIEHLKHNTINTYTILIKGSRGIRLEKLLDLL